MSTAISKVMAIQIGDCKSCHNVGLIGTDMRLADVFRVCNVKDASM